MTDYRAVPKNDRLKRFDILDMASAGTGKEVIASNIRREEVAHNLAASWEMRRALEKIDQGLAMLDQDKFGAMRLMIHLVLKRADGGHLR